MQGPGWKVCRLHKSSGFATDSEIGIDEDCPISQPCDGCCPEITCPSFTPVECPTCPPTTSCSPCPTITYIPSPTQTPTPASQTTPPAIPGPSMYYPIEECIVNSSLLTQLRECGECS